MNMKARGNLAFFDHRYLYMGWRRDFNKNTWARHN